MFRPSTSFSSAAENMSLRLSEHPAIKLDSAPPACSRVAFREASERARRRRDARAHTRWGSMETNRVLLIDHKVKW